MMNYISHEISLDEVEYIISTCAIAIVQDCFGSTSWPARWTISFLRIPMCARQVRSPSMTEPASESTPGRYASATAWFASGCRSSRTAWRCAARNRFCYIASFHRPTTSPSRNSRKSTSTTLPWTTLTQITWVGSLGKAAQPKRSSSRGRVVRLPWEAVVPTVLIRISTRITIDCMYSLPRIRKRTWIGVYKRFRRSSTARKMKNWKVRVNVRWC